MVKHNGLTPFVLTVSGEILLLENCIRYGTGYKMHTCVGEKLYRQ